jgi:hypothetical protein
MALRPRFLILIALLISTFIGCGKSSPPGAPAPAETGGESSSAGQNTAEGGEAGAAPVGGSSTGGTAGSSAGFGALGGVAGSGVAGSGVAGSGGAGSGGAAGSAFTGGSGGVAVSGGASGSAGSGGSPVVAGWTCDNSYFDDGKCDCGCGAADADCERSDSVAECERCNCAGGCPGRVNPEETARCLPPPSLWSCTPSRYGDGVECDCGCGVRDIDCEDGSVESCDVCYGFRGCANGTCPSNVAPDDNAECATPLSFLCDARLYGDDRCDCGCGVVDVDCESANAEACELCPDEGCAYGMCSLIMADNNAACSEPPSHWVCPVRLYDDGSQCDCGCGFPDPDCSDNLIAACDKCNDVGSCSGQACPGTIDPNANERCEQPPPPEGWTCDDNSYADGYQCDCGCGVFDLDCRTSTLESCEQCRCGHGSCPDWLDPEDPTKCAPPPDTWLCAEERFNDDECDCGCGASDPSCVYSTALYCTRCDSCGDCDRVNFDDNTQCVSVPEAWTCLDEHFFDDVCDCGCGALDQDCSSASRSVCEYCNSDGSCSDVVCTDPASAISQSDNTRCD